MSGFLRLIGKVSRGETVAAHNRNGRRSLGGRPIRHIGQIHKPSTPASAAAGATITYTDNAGLVSVTSVFTFSGRALGTPSADRIILVGTYGNRFSAGIRSVSALTANGTSLSLVKDWGGASNNTMEVWGGVVTSGATGDVVVTFAGGDMSCCGIMIGAISGANTTVYATASSTADPPSAGINVTAGGVVFAYAVNVNIAESFTWTNATEKFDEAIQIAVAYHSGATDNYATAQTPITVTADPDQPISEGGLILVSYQAA